MEVFTLKTFFKKWNAKITALALVALTALAALPVAVGAAPIDFSTTTGVDIAPTDIISTGFSFAKMFDAQTTLVLGLIFAPVGIGFLIWLIRKLPKFGGSKS
jgi:hypothetical protein